jgi:phosphoglycolate phosphatase-like HAD superfamily hydrolase
VLEVIRPYPAPVNLRVAIFDFDGTLSLIRSGWVQIMLDLFVREIKSLRTGEREEDLREHFEDVILQLTGKQTLHQMQALVDAVEARGGRPRSASEYKERFLHELMQVAKSRIGELRSGSASPDQYLVPGARKLLDCLEEQGAALYLASGTDEEDVKEEAVALDISRYFGPHIYGARTDGGGFTKAALVKHVLDVDLCKPAELVAFGDGFVEINEVSKSCGLAIGVATDEPECRRIDQRKRKHLVAAGANYVIPNYVDIAEITQVLQPPALVRER